MTNRKTELTNHFKTFAEICKKHKIWYAASGTTLRGTVTNKGMLAGDEKIEVMMTIESYEKLKEKAHEYLIDGAMNSSYPVINPKFIPNDERFDTTNIFIDILIVVPTTAQKVKKWSKLGNRHNFLLKKLHSNYVPFDGKEKFLKVISTPFKRIYKQLTFKTAYNKLYEKKNDGFYLIHRPNCKPFEHWIPHITLNVEKMTFEGIKINVPAEYKTILEIKYGKSYKKFIDPEHPTNYINSVSTSKKEL